MKMRSKVALAAATVTALSMGVASPVGAQDAPSLGFEIDPTEGSPGDTVAGSVDVSDVAEHCPTTVEEISSRFGELRQALETILPEYEPGEGDTTQSTEYMGATMIALLSFAIEGNLVFEEDPPPGTPGAADLMLPQAFVMTFADIATQAPVGERANFAPDEGTATVVVPDVDPGMWAVAATCVAPSTDEATLRQAITTAAALLEDEFDLADEVPLDWEFPGGFEAAIAWLTEAAPTLLEPLMVPQALGFQLFCVQDATGACPGDTPPSTAPTGPGTTTPPPGPGTTTPPPAPPARPVTATPNYTG